MFNLYANKNQLTIRRREPVTSGSVNAYWVRFEFSADWTGLTRTAIFRAGTESRAVLLEADGGCAIPWEVLQKPGVELFCGVYGTQGGHTVLPTIWASLGRIVEGAALGEDARPPTPELWEQQLAAKGDALAYDGLNLSLMSGDKLLSTVEIAGGGGEGGASDHRLLTGREAEDQHPISSIVNLEKKLSTIPSAMTADELRKILMT